MTSASSAARRHTRNPRGAGDRLRHELIAAASHLLEDGATPQALSLRSVAREVGIAATSVYLHFPDKASLLLAVYERHFAELAGALGLAIAAHDKPGARLRALAHGYCQFAASHPDTYYVLFSMPGLASAAGPRPGAAIIDTVQQVVTECMDADLIPAGDPLDITLCLWATLHGLITLRAARPQVPWPGESALVDTALATLLRPSGG